MTYSLIRLGDVLRFERIPIDIEPEKEYVQIGIRSFGLGIFHYPPTLGEELSKVRYFSIEPNRLIVSNIMAWEGAIAASNTSEAGCIGSHRFLSYAACGGVNLDYLNYFFQSSSGRKLIKRTSTGTVLRNQTVSRKDFEELRAPLPDVDEQCRIATKLDAALREQSRLNATIARANPSLAARMVPRLIQSVFERWHDSHSTVGDMCAVVGDLVRPGDDPGPATVFVGLEHIAPHLGVRVGLRDVGDETGRKFRFAPGDVLYGYLRPYLNKVWVADRHGLCSVDQYVLRPKDGISPEALSFTLRSQAVLDQVRALTSNLQLPRLRSGLLLGLNVPRLSAAHQGTVVERLRRLNEISLHHAATLQRRIELVNALKPAILNAAFTGHF